MTVGAHEQLAVRSVRTRGRLYLPVDEAVVKLRYRSAPVRGVVTTTDDGFALELGEPAYGVATGQVAVLYDRDAVVGAGVITDVV